jgi:hypothetical protein
VATKFLTSIDLNGTNEIQNALIQNLSTAPSSPAAGRIYFDTTLGKLRYYSGSAWISLDAAGAGAVNTISGTSPVVATNNGGGSYTISINAASTSAAGAVQLSDSATTTSSVLAATPTAVKVAYDLASGKANPSDTTYVGTTSVALNRASANQALTGISSVTLPGSTSGTAQIIPTAIAGTGTVITLPATTGTVALTANNLGSFATSTSAAIGVGTIDLGHASDTTLSRSAAGTLAVEGVDVVTTSATQTLTNKTLTSPSLTTPTLGVASATSVNKVAITAPATSATLALADGSTLATSGAFSTTLTATATTVATLPAGTKTLLATDGNGSGLTSLTAGNLSGTIPSGVLGNSSVNVGTTSVALNRASANLALTGISSVALPGSTSGTITVQPAATAGTNTITLPAVTGTVVTTGDTTSVTNGMIASGIAFAKLSAPVGAFDFGGQTLTNLATPSAASDAATKAYVDAVKTGLDVKDSVRAATTANITLSGTQTIDGVAVIAGDRVLVKDQSTGSQNGIYVVAASAWSRSSDADLSSEVTAGLFTFVEEGTANADSGWVLTTNNAITLGTTALTFAQFSGAGQITAGSGLSKSGNTLSVNFDSTTINASGASSTLQVIDASITAAKLATSAVDLAGTKITGTLPLGNGGTGATTASTARDSLAESGFSLARRKSGSATWTAGEAKALTHSLGTKDVTVAIYDSSDALVFTDVATTSTSVVTVTISLAGTYRYVIIG